MADQRSTKEKVKSFYNSFVGPSSGSSAPAHCHPPGRIGTYLLRKTLHIPTHDAKKSASFTSLMVIHSPPPISLFLVHVWSGHMTGTIARPELRYLYHNEAFHQLEIVRPSFSPPSLSVAPRRWNYSTSLVLQVWRNM